MSFEKWGESSRTQSSNCSAIIHNDITNQAIALSSGDFKPVSALHRGPCVDVRAHLTVLGAFLALFCTFGQMNTFGTFQTWYASHQLQSMPPSTISWIGSLQLWVFFVSGAPIGHVFDLYGPTALMTAGSVIFVASLMLTSISTRYYQYLLFQGVFFGLGVGLLFYPSLASVFTHFKCYRATMLGIAAAGSSVGGVVFPVLLQHLFESVGFSWGVRISGLLSLVGCAIATICVTRITQKMSDCHFDVKAIFDIRFTLLVVGSFLVALGLYIPYFYVVDYARHLSISPDASLYVLAAMNGGGIFGRIAPAYLSDTIGRFNLLVPSAFFSGLSCLVIWLFSRNLTTLMVFAVLYGFFSGGFISIVTPCVAQISDIRQIGISIGLLYTIISVPSLVGGPIAGAILQASNGSFAGMIVFSGSTVSAGSLVILLSRIAIERQILARV